jgi:hypothetical protein
VRFVGRCTAGWGLPSSGVLTVVRVIWAICTAILGAGAASADPAASMEPTTLPDPPPRQGTPAIGPSALPPSWDLDGLYVWLGPLGAAGRLEGAWDSTFGADLSIVRVREAAPLGAVGVSAGASRWTERGGGRIWLDALAGTRLGGRMYGASLGPLVELAELEHARIGGAVGLWAFFGPTPYARLGVVGDRGAFVEIGLHLALPVLRWRGG